MIYTSKLPVAYNRYMHPHQSRQTDALMAPPNWLPQVDLLEVIVSNYGKSDLREADHPRAFTLERNREAQSHMLVLCQVIEEKRMEEQWIHFDDAYQLYKGRGSAKSKANCLSFLALSSAAFTRPNFSAGKYRLEFKIEHQATEGEKYAVPIHYRLTTLPESSDPVALLQKD